MYRHGMSRSPAYGSWLAMKKRCNDPNHRWYRRYGGRGIKVAPEWNSDFTAFYVAMGDRPPGHTLDRINNAGDYCPTNCRWADARTQRRNRG